MNRLLLASVLLLGSVAVRANGGEATSLEAHGAELPLDPATLSDALSCRSYDAALAFGAALFLERRQPEWMTELRAASNPETRAMIGLHGYRLREPLSFYGQPVDRVYFMKDWVVTLWPRARAEAFVREQKMERAPIRMTEQYYRFLHPEEGPMLGVFEPTGAATAQMFAKALGAPVEETPPSEVLFVGCNYAPATQREFLDAAEKADLIADGAAKEIGGMVGIRE